MITSQLLFIGTTELMLIAGIALLLFGGKKLPEMMRGMGRGISEFKKGDKEVTEPCCWLQVSGTFAHIDGWKLPCKLLALITVSRSSMWK